MLGTICIVLERFILTFFDIQKLENLETWKFRLKFTIPRPTIFTFRSIKSNFISLIIAEL